MTDNINEMKIFTEYLGKILEKIEDLIITDFDRISSEGQDTLMDIQKITKNEIRRLFVNDKKG